MDNTKEKNGKSLVSTIANILSSIVLVFAILVCVLVIGSLKSSSGVASLFGYAVLSVKSDSMEPTFSKGDLIIIKTTKPSERFKQGEIISFFAYDIYGSRFVNSHRIVKVMHGETRDKYTTKGDNAPAEDNRSIYSNSIVGRYTGKKITGLGKAVDFISSPNGILLCVVIPSAIIIIAQVISYVDGAKKRKRQMMLEAEERARQERIQFVNELAAAQRGAVSGAMYVPPVQLDPNVEIEDADKKRVIEEYLQRQAQEEAKKQAIIEEYLQKQKEAEQAAKEEAEAAKIKAIIAEFLAQQQAGGDTPKPETEESPSGPEDSEG